MHNEILSLRPSLPTGNVSSSRVKSFLKMVLCVVAVAACSIQASAQAYQVANIISDGSVAATTMDPNFINPWAISTSPTWWISAQGTGFSYVVSAAGVINFKVIVPAASGGTTATGLPAGSVTTAGAATGMVLPNGTKASFLFSTLDGTISGWNSKLGTANALSQIAINNSAAGASYPGLAILTVGTNSYLLAANFGKANKIEVYDSNFAAAKLTGTFTDPNLPSNYGPFAVHVLGSKVYVSYAVRTPTAPYFSVNAPGNGIVSVFDTAGNFVARAVNGGNLNAPWGVAFAPANFGIYSNDLLVGNFGDGIINVYDPTSYAYLGQLVNGTGKPIVNASLWELLTGGTAIGGSAAVSAGDKNTVYFTAGLAGEKHGLFGGISNATTAGSTPTFGFSTSASTALVAGGSAAQPTFSVSPVNGFSGTVTLACNGLPKGATCTFSPAQLTVTPTAPATGMLTIQTARSTSSLRQEHRGGIYVAGIAAVFLLPFGSILAFRRRRLSDKGMGALRLLSVLIVCLAAGGFIVGCSQSAETPSTPVAGTPAGQSMVTITATSGAVSQQTTFALNVQ